MDGLPVIVPFGHALQGEAGAGGFAFEFGEEEFGQLHVGFSCDRLRGGIDGVNGSSY